MKWGLWIVKRIAAPCCFAGTFGGAAAAMAGFGYWGYAAWLCVPIPALVLYAAVSVVGLDVMTDEVTS